MERGGKNRDALFAACREGKIVLEKGRLKKKIFLTLIIELPHDRSACAAEDFNPSSGTILRTRFFFSQKQHKTGKHHILQVSKTAPFRRRYFPRSTAPRPGRKLL